MKHNEFDGIALEEFTTLLNNTSIEQQQFLITVIEKFSISMDRGEESLRSRNVIK